MHTGAFVLLTRSPYIAAVVFYNLLYNGQPDSAASLGGIAGRVRPVKPLKYIRQILVRYSLSVVLDLHPDGIHFIQNTDVDDASLLIQIFDAVADNVADNPFELLRVCNNLRGWLHQILVV